MDVAINTFLIALAIPIGLAVGGFAVVLVANVITILWELSKFLWPEDMYRRHERERRIRERQV